MDLEYQCSCCDYFTVGVRGEWEICPVSREQHASPTQYQNCDYRNEVRALQRCYRFAGDQTIDNVFAELEHAPSCGADVPPRGGSHPKDARVFTSRRMTCAADHYRCVESTFETRAWPGRNRLSPVHQWIQIEPFVRGRRACNHDWLLPVAFVINARLGIDFDC